MSQSSHADRFILKGGALLAAYEVRRPTRDVDLHGIEVSNEGDRVLALVRELAGGIVEDGLAFDAHSATATTIRDQDDYSGIRVSMSCQFATAQIPFHVDVNVGDPIVPAAGRVRLPRLLGGQISLLGYPLSMVYAEKIVTAVQRRAANTRWRDFADIYLLSRQHMTSGDELQQSVRAVADHRQTGLLPLSAALDGLGDVGASRWRAWIHKQRLSDRLPDDLALVLGEVSHFADPAILGHTSALTWDPTTLSWNAAGANLN